MKIYIIGTSCSGKTTLAEKLARILDLTHIELDQLWWLPDWQERSFDEFREMVIYELKNHENWVVDGNYRRVQNLLLAEVDQIIWLNLPFTLVFWRSITRTIRRIFSQEIVCNGNRENWRALFSWDSMPVWVIRTYRLRKLSGRKLKGEDKRVIELRNMHEVTEFVSSLENKVHY
jgi:adenylate kinase family enzyme